MMTRTKERSLQKTIEVIVTETDMILAEVVVGLEEEDTHKEVEVVLTPAGVGGEPTFMIAGDSLLGPTVVTNLKETKVLGENLHQNTIKTSRERYRKIRQLKAKKILRTL